MAGASSYLQYQNKLKAQERIAHAQRDVAAGLPEVGVGGQRSEPEAVPDVARKTNTTFTIENIISPDFKRPSKESPKSAVHIPALVRNLYDNAPNSIGAKRNQYLSAIRATPMIGAEHVPMLRNLVVQQSNHVRLAHHQNSRHAHFMLGHTHNLYQRSEDVGAVMMSPVNTAAYMTPGLANKTYLDTAKLSNFKPYAL